MTDSNTKASADSSGAKSLTEQILDEFQDSLRTSGTLDENTVDSLLEIARADTKPKAKDVQALFSEQEALE